MFNFYRSGAEEALKSLGSSPVGISDEEAKLRLQKYGANALEKGKKTGPQRIIVLQGPVIIPPPFHCFQPYTHLPSATWIPRL